MGASYARIIPPRSPTINPNTQKSAPASTVQSPAPFKAARFLRLLGRHPRLSFDTVCEVGGGSGEILVQLARQMPPPTQFFGFYISQDALAIALPKTTGQLHFALKNLTNPSEARVYDLLLQNPQGARSARGPGAVVLAQSEVLHQNPRRLLPHGADRESAPEALRLYSC